jgi:hypothetical protein
LYALSESGKVYALATDAEKQKLPARVSVRGPWWSIGRLWDEAETVDFVEITAKEPLARGEKYGSIESLQKGTKRRFQVRFDRGW